MRRKQRESQTSETYRCNVYGKQGRYRNSGIRDNGISKDRQESQGVQFPGLWIQILLYSVLPHVIFTARYQLDRA